MSAIYTMAPQGDWYNSLSVGLDYKKFDETCLLYTSRCV